MEQNNNNKNKYIFYDFLMFTKRYWIKFLMFPLKKKEKKHIPSEQSPTLPITPWNFPLPSCKPHMNLFFRLWPFKIHIKDIYSNNNSANHNALFFFFFFFFLSVLAWRCLTSYNTLAFRTVNAIVKTLHTNTFI